MVDQAVVIAVRHYLDVLRREHALDVRQGAVFGPYARSQGDTRSDINSVIVAPPGSVAEHMESGVRCRPPIGHASLTHLDAGATLIGTSRATRPPRPACAYVEVPRQLARLEFNRQATVSYRGNWQIFCDC